MITSMPRIAIAVRDYDAAVSTFRETFGMPVVDMSDRTVPDLGAHIGMCVPEGGSNIELMCPADPDAPLSQSLLKFLDRRGVGPYALMLEAPDPDAETDLMTGRGIDVLPLMAGAGGRDLHPRSTSGVLIRVYPVNSAGDLSGHGSNTNGDTAEAISGITKVIIATADAAAASKIYGHGLGLTVDPVANDAERGVDVVLCHPPEGGVIELVSVVDRTRPFAKGVQQTVDERGHGMYAWVLTAKDPERAADRLKAGGLTVTQGRDSSGNTTLETAILGTNFLIEAA